MPTGPGGLDSEGIWQFGEADTDTLFSDVLNLGQGSVSTQFGVDRTRMDGIETDILAVEDDLAERITAYTRTAANLATSASFANLDFDNTPLSGSDFTESNGAFTCQRAAVYLIQLAVTFGASATNLRGIRLTGTMGDRYRQVGSVSGSLTLTETLLWVLNLAVNDVVTVQAQQNSGGNLSTSAQIVFTRLG